MPDIVTNLNKRKLKRIGYLTPAQINSNLDDVLVQEALKEHKIVPYQQPDWREQEKNQAKYEAKKENLQVGDFVYKDDKLSVFQKSYEAYVRLYSKMELFLVLAFYFRLNFSFYLVDFFFLGEIWD